MLTQVLWFVLVAPFAQAGVADYCTPVKNLTKKLSSCTDNEVLFADAAVTCLEKFEAEATVASKALETMLLGSGQSAEGVKSQEKLLAGTEKNYQATKARLDLLILSGKRALEQVDDYIDNIAMPEDLETSGDLGFTAEEFLASIPCYHENKEVLFDVGDDLEAKIEELEMARAVIDDLEKKSKAAKAGVGSESAASPVTNGQGQGGGAKAPGPKAKTGQSDITGTEKKSESLDKK